MGTDPFTKSWWFLEAHDGSWLADRDHELFTRDPNKALKWPNFTDADRARRALHHPLWHRIIAPTEHVFVDLEAPTPPPVPAITREELVGIIRPWIEAARARASPEPWEVAANCTNGAAEAILARLAAGQPPETEK